MGRFKDSDVPWAFVVSVICTIAGIAFLYFDIIPYHIDLAIYAFLLSPGIPAIYYVGRRFIEVVKEELKK